MVAATSLWLMLRGSEPMEISTLVPGTRVSAAESSNQSWELTLRTQEEPPASEVYDGWERGPGVVQLGGFPGA